MGAPEGNQYAIGNDGGRPLAYESVDELEKAIEEYFDKEEGDAWIDMGDTKVFMPTVSGLAFHLGIATETLRRYEHKDEFCVTVKKAKQRIEISLEQRLAGQAVTGTIFNLKNNFGWKDKSEQELTGANGGPMQIQEVKRTVVDPGNTDS